MGILGPMFMEIYRPGSVYSNSDALGPVNVATCMPLFEAACFNFMSWYFVAFLYY